MLDVLSGFQIFDAVLSCFQRQLKFQFGQLTPWPELEPQSSDESVPTERSVEPLSEKEGYLLGTTLTAQDLGSAWIKPFSS